MISANLITKLMIDGSLYIYIYMSRKHLVLSLSYFLFSLRT